MALDPKPTALALQRFGLGARSSDLAQAGANPRGFLEDEVRRRSVAQPAGPDLMDTASAIAALREQRQGCRVEKMPARQPSEARPDQEAAPAMDGMASRAGAAGAVGSGAALPRRSDGPRRERPGDALQ